jgi:putative endonuclease
MAEHIKTGKEGEDAAIEHLKKSGYDIIEVNWRHKHLELDIIALENDILVVVEVKTRTSDVFGNPEIFVDRAKQKNIIKACNAFILERKVNNEVRFDIISIVTARGKIKLDHIRDAFSAHLN